VRAVLAAVALLFFMLFASLALYVSDPVASGVFVRVCGHVVGVRHLNHGCAYTIISSGHVYTVLDFYRSCSGVSKTCFMGRLVGDGEDTVYCPFFG